MSELRPQWLELQQSILGQMTVHPRMIQHLQKASAAYRSLRAAASPRPSAECWITRSWTGTWPWQSGTHKHRINELPKPFPPVLTMLQSPMSQQAWMALYRCRFVPHASQNASNTISACSCTEPCRPCLAAAKLGGALGLLAEQIAQPKLGSDV